MVMCADRARGIEGGRRKEEEGGRGGERVGLALLFPY